MTTTTRTTKRANSKTYLRVNGAPKTRSGGQENTKPKIRMSKIRMSKKRM
jgi:hypothetical protein